MKKLFYIPLILFITQQSLGKSIDWNLRRFVPNEKVAKRCDQEPRAWLWFNKSEVEMACDGLEADLNIIRQAYEVAGEARVASLDPNIEKINKFLTGSTSKMLDEQQVRTAMNTIFSYESFEAREQETQRFISTRASHILKFFQDGAKNRSSEMVKHARLNIVESAARHKTRMMEDGAKTDAFIIKNWMEKGRTPDQCNQMITTMYEMYPELRKQ